MEGTTVVATTPGGAPVAAATTKPMVTQEEGEKWYAKLASSYLIFLIVTAIVLAFVTAIFITNTIFYDKINKNKGCNGAVTESEANTLYWLNLVLAVISGIFFFAAVVLAFLQYEKPDWTEKYTGRLTYVPGTSVEAARQRVAPLALRAQAGARRFQAGAADVGRRARVGGAALQRRGAAGLAAARDPQVLAKAQAFEQLDPNYQQVLLGQAYST